MPIFLKSTKPVYFDNNMACYTMRTRKYILYVSIIKSFCVDMEQEICKSSIQQSRQTHAHTCTAAVYVCDIYIIPRSLA